MASLLDTRFSRLPGWAKWLLGVAGAIFLAAVYGVIGNRTDAGVLWLWPWMQRQWFGVVWDWKVLLFPLLFLLGYCLYLRRRLAALARLSGVDNSLLLLLPELASAHDREGTMRRIVEEFLSDASDVFDGEVIRSTVFRPEGDYLVAWESAGMPKESTRRTKFYIGSDPLIKRGSGGEAFVKKEIRVVRAWQKKGRPQTDDAEAYIHFDEKRKRLPYKSFAAVPLIEGDQSAIGLLCFDSSSGSSFHSRQIREIVLPALADRLVAAILIYERLETERTGGGRPSGR